MSGTRVLTCEEALHFLATYLDGELGPETDRELEAHLARCRSCYSRADFERRLKDRLAGLGQSDVRREFAERMRRLMDAFPGSTPES
jgi:anti-sigma factor (TIGR02949 family)